MTQLATLQNLHEKIKAEQKLVEQRLEASKVLVAGKSAGCAPISSQEASLRDGLVHSLGQLFLHYNSRSTSVAGTDDNIDTADTAPSTANRNPSPAPNTDDLSASPQAPQAGRVIVDIPSASSSSAPATPVPTPSSAAGRSGTPPPPTGGFAAAGTPTSRSSSVQGVVGQTRPPPPPAKGGILLNYGLPGLLRSFKSQFVVVETDVIRWFKSQDAYNSASAPIGAVPLHTVQKNSRGSVIKQVAACWPFITTEECSKASDPSKHYFGVQYIDEKSGALQFLVLAAATPEEKRDWVMHLAQLVPLHLPPDAPTQFQGTMYIDMAQNIVPHHAKTVLSGEAPKH